MHGPMHGLMHVHVVVDAHLLILLILLFLFLFIFFAACRLDWGRVRVHDPVLSSHQLTFWKTDIVLELEKTV